MKMKIKITLILIWLSVLSAYGEGTDFDTDGIDDIWEFDWFGNLSTANATSDYDNDGLSDLNESLLGTYPIVKDTDFDNMWDGYEVQYGLNPTNSVDGALDSDSDTIINSNEFIYSSCPTNRDTDYDGLSDSNEIYRVYQIETVHYHAIPVPPYFMYYYDEPTNFPIVQTSVTDGDSDNDGVSDFKEIYAGTDPNDPDDYLKMNNSVLRANETNYLSITWKPISNRGYYVETTTNLLNNSWTNINYFVATNTGHVISNLVYFSHYNKKPDINYPGYFATNTNDTCSWSIPLTNNSPSIFYRVRVKMWIDRDAYYEIYPTNGW